MEYFLGACNAFSTHTHVRLQCPWTARNTNQSTSGTADHHVHDIPSSELRQESNYSSIHAFRLQLAATATHIPGPSRQRQKVPGRPICMDSIPSSICIFPFSIRDMQYVQGRKKAHHLTWTPHGMCCAYINPTYDVPTIHRADLAYTYFCRPFPGASSAPKKLISSLGHVLLSWKEDLSSSFSSLPLGPAPFSPSHGLMRAILVSYLHACTGQSSIQLCKSCVCKLGLGMGMETSFFVFGSISGYMPFSLFLGACKQWDMSRAAFLQGGRDACSKQHICTL